jgi:hypothetical protein
MCHHVGLTLGVLRVCLFQWSTTLMNAAFERYIGIDYSGAQTPASSLKGLRVYAADRLTTAQEVEPPLCFLCIDDKSLVLRTISIRGVPAVPEPLFEPAGTSCRESRSAVISRSN